MLPFLHALLNPTASSVPPLASPPADPIIALFGVGDDGFYLDFQDLSVLFQDTGFTTPVTTDGQNIAGIHDKSGNDRHFIQGPVAGSTSIPLLWQDDTHDYADFGDQPGGQYRYIYNTSPFIYAADGATIFAALNATPAGPGLILLMEGSTAASNPFYAPLRANATTATTNSEFVRNDAGTILSNQTIVGTSALDSSDRVIVMTDTGSGWEFYLDGALIDTGSYTRSGTLTLTHIAIGARLINSLAAGVIFNGNVIGAIDRVLDAGEIAALTTALGARQGRTL
jgi:hypothetical protein